ncbi:Usp (universal stress protein) family protein [Schizosaccharomyces osmophilus]|uniref:Usp (Universal stress protein) family protein n=1 Tax=Schizosaccharomyces osmophilus TaxID=2545709 RepID=A0AAE9W9T3_9SCHI|nr:Usp (universal stress protein) family protein [Schizosaccharomyces osmophilus]WBW71412.1 Usp (universal stress protein) family protein [Schizosaccharomyces osmophilus]
MSEDQSDSNGNAKEGISFGNLPRPESKEKSKLTIGTNVQRQAHSEPVTPVTRSSRSSMDKPMVRPVAKSSVTFAAAQGAGFIQPQFEEYPYNRPHSLASPPPSPHFLKRISFDTFNNKAASEFSLTLKTQHRAYKWTRASRTFLCGMDENIYSEFAVEYLFESLLSDNDEVVILRVIDPSSKMAEELLDENSYRLMAENVMASLLRKIDEEKAVSIIVELLVGKPQDMILRTIHTYSPDSLIVGTRGKPLNSFQSLLSSGSVSKFCLQRSPIPVIVVRPDRKRMRSKNKRLKDKTRKSYMEILEKSGR